MTNQTDTDAERATIARSAAEPATRTTLVGVFATHAAAEQAVKELDDAGIPMRQLSIIGKDYRTEERPVGFYNLGDRVRVWGARGAFWGGLIGLLVSPAFFLLPVVGHVIVLGPLTSALVGALEGVALGGGVSALAGALASVGVPRDSVIRYEAAIKADKFVLIVHSVANGAAAIAEQVLRDTSAESVERV
jgi:uncharacterized membrane protein